MTPVTSLSTNGSSYSPPPPIQPRSVEENWGSGPIISLSSTSNGLSNHNRRSSSNRIGTQQIQRMCTTGGTYSSSRLHTPSPSSSAGIERLSFGSVAQLVSLRSIQPSLSSSMSSIRMGVQLVESVEYLQVSSSGIPSESVSSQAVESFGNASMRSPILSPSSSSSIWLQTRSRSMSSGKETGSKGSLSHSSSSESLQPSLSLSGFSIIGARMMKSTV